MRDLAATISTLLAGIALLLLGIGLLGVLLGLRGLAAGFGETAIGVVMAGYFLGFIAGAQLCPDLIRRVGHIRTFAALAATASVSVLLHPLLVTPLAWFLLRLLTGTALVGIYMVFESWLNERATPATRGRTLALYQLTTLGAIGVGPLLLLAGPVDAAGLFVLCAGLICAAVVPVTLTPVPEPVLDAETERLSLAALARLSPMAMAGTVGAALTSSAFFALGAVFAQQSGLSKPLVAVFASAVVLGGAALQWPIGHYSDRYDRRGFIAGVSVAGLLLALVLMAVPGRWPGWLLTAAFCYGGAMLTLYPLSAAHLNDQVRREQLLEAARALLLVYGAGAAVGPMLAGVLMGRLGPGALFGFSAAVSAGVALFALGRRIVAPMRMLRGRRPFVTMVRTSPVALEMLEQPETQPPGGRGASTEG